MFTILGSTGFIGSSLVTALQEQGHEVYLPRRDDSEIFSRDLGHVIYAAGMTADFRGRPFETVEAHVCLLQRVLRSCNFQSLLYLSSTRIYNMGTRAEEEQRVTVDPANPDELYNLTKLMGESLCLATGRDSVRVVRLSNVYGGDFGSKNFLAEVLTQALLEGRVRLRTALESSRNYVCIADVVAVLPRVALAGEARLYNIAGCRNISHGELLNCLSRYVPLTVEVDDRAPTVAFPSISIDRVRKEFGFSPKDLTGDLADLVAEFRSSLAQKDDHD